MASNWFYVFQSATGTVSIGNELRGRECAYQSQSYADAQAFARRLTTTHGRLSSVSEVQCAVKASGRAIAGAAMGNLDETTAPRINLSSLIVRSTSHIPARRISA